MEGTHSRMGFEMFDFDFLSPPFEADSLDTSLPDTRVVGRNSVECRRDFLVLGGKVIVVPLVSSTIGRLDYSTKYK